MRRRLIERVRAWWPWRDRDAELDEEIAFHLSEEADAQRADGATDDAAPVAARRDFGNVTMVREDMREAWGWGPVERFVQDVRYGVRALTAAPIVSIVAVLTLTLAIGANSAIFSLVNGLLLRPLPVAAPERLVLLSVTVDGDGTERAHWTNPIWEQLRDRALFDGAFAWGVQRFNLAPSGESDLVSGLWVSGRMFDVLGVQTVAGRPLTAEDDRRGLGPDGPVAVLGYDFWQRRFGGSPDAIGRRITVERVPFTIVGVAPPSFFGAEVGRTFDVAIPIAAATLVKGADALDRRTSWWLRVMFRLKPGQGPDAANAQLAALSLAIRQATQPTDWPLERYLPEGLAVVAAPNGPSSLRRVYQRPVTVLMGVVFVVLLIACANLANLLLARTAARRPELSLRLALGASRARIARQLLLESLLIAGAGAIGGLIVARFASQTLVHALSTINTAVRLDIVLDWRSLGFTAAVGTLTALFFGVAPALRGTRAQPSDALKQQGRGGAAAHGRLGHTLVVAQVALSLVLLVAAGLFVRTFTTLTHRDLGFDPAPVLTARIVPGSTLTTASGATWSARVIEAASRVPGVRSAALSHTVPLSGNNWNNRVDLAAGPPRPEAPLTWFNLVTPGWFATYGTPILDGRDFTASDAAGAVPAAIVNEAFARAFTGGRSPVGLEIREPGDGRTPVVRRIVGWVKDAVYESVRGPAPPTLYLPYAQAASAPAETMLNVRVDGGTPGVVARPLAAALAGVDPAASVTFRRLSEHVDDRLTRERLLAMLAGGFGILAVVLAGVGLYGVTAYAVDRQRSEIAVRMALGASAGRVVARVLGGVASRVAMGAAIGIGLTAWAAPVVETLVYGLTPRDRVTITGAALLLGAVGALAGWIPARRISRIDPARVLRDG
jgi:putative ABC transport system permease protein